jgi:hypothetical protein
MNKQFIKFLQYRTAEVAIGPSTLRNQGNKGVVAAARNYLKTIDLFKFSVTTERRFKSVLDTHTNKLKISFPKGARHWGTARKALNLFLRDVLYNRYLSRHFGFRQIENLLEIPLDKDAAKGIRKCYKTKKLPSWEGIKDLTPQTSKAYQDAATCIASACKIGRVHLDVLYWRGVGRNSKMANKSLEKPTGKR